MFSFLLVQSFLWAGGGHHHGHGGHGHGDSHEEEHEHHDIESRFFTLYDRGVELFVDLQKHGESDFDFILHFTELQNHKALTLTNLTFRTSSGPVRLGGEWKQTGVYVSIVEKLPPDLIVEGSLKNGSGNLTFHLENILPWKPREEGETISFTKEAQWSVDFALGIVKKRPIQQNHLAPAEALLLEKSHIDIRPSAGSKVLKVYVQELDQVESGQSLIRMHPGRDVHERLVHHRLELQESKIERDYLLSETERIRSLVSKGSMAQKFLLEVENKLKLQDKKVVLYEHEFEEFLHQEGIEIEGEEAFVELKAPRAGVVVDLKASEGTWVGQGETLLTIVDSKQLIIEAHLSSQHGSFQVESGLFRLLGKEEWKDLGTLVDLSEGKWLPVLDKHGITQTWRAPVRSDSLGLRAGEGLEVQLREGGDSQSLSVPREAVSIEQGSHFIYLYRDGESFERALVKTGVWDAQHIEILEGLQEGQLIVRKGVYNLRLAASADKMPEHGHSH